MLRLSSIPQNEVTSGQVRSRRCLLGDGFRALAGFVCAGVIFALPAAAEGERDKRERPERGGDRREGDRPEGPPHFHPEMEREFSLKAAYLSNLARFVDWPSEVLPRPDSPIVIGVLAKPEFFGYFQRFLRDRRLDGRAIFLKPIRKPADVRACHILFVNGRVSERTPRVVHHIPKDHPILTVGESPTFLQQGGILNFALVDRKIVLEVNPEAAKRACLAISPKLLAICKQPLKDVEK